MKISLVVILFYITHRINCTLHYNLTKYLDSQSKIVREKLIRHRRNQINSYDVKFNHINDFRLTGNYSSGEIFTIFNNYFALLDRDLYQVSHYNYTIIDDFQPKEEITLLKATQYKNLGLLLYVTKSTILHIFGFNNQTQKFFKIQNIVQTDVSDATFFENQGNLYLLVANHHTNTAVYKFLRSHFDEFAKIQTRAVTKLYTFPNNGSEIIVILQNSPLTSLLYKFKNENLVTLQKIDTNNPKQVLSYFYDNQRYVQIFEKTTIKLYLWGDSELLLIENIFIDVETEQKEIIYANKNPFLLASNNNSVLIYSLMKNQYKQIFSEKITDIWNFKIWPQNKSSLIILGHNFDKVVQISTYSVEIKVNFSGQLIEENEKLSNCFQNLEKNVYKFRNKLDLRNKNQNVVREADSEESNDELPQMFGELQRRYLEIKSMVNGSEAKRQKMIMNRTMVVNSVKANRAVMQNLEFENLNDRKWQPKQWLSYSQPQNISGFIKVKSMQINNLVIDDNEILFQDLLLTNGDQIMSGSLSVNSLESTKIQTKSINNISVDNIYYKSNPVQVQGLKRFPSMTVKNLDTSQINELEGGRILSFLTNPDLVKYNFGENLKIDNLWVNQINEVDFDEFKNSVFRIGLTDTIVGNLTFINIEARNINFDTLSQKSEFFTTSTNQLINTSITFSKIFTKNVKAETINGIDFKNSVATFDGSVINGPITIKNIKVKNDLEMRGKVDKRFLIMNKTHIIGTNESDLLQQYNKKVKIKGNLFLKNLDLGKNAKMVIFDNDFDPAIDQFWTKTTQQTIPIHFEAQNGISTPHVFATFINNISVDDYMLNSTEQTKTTRFYFDDVKIKGNVLLNSEKPNSPDLRRIKDESVKTNGIFNIKGQKTYTNALKIDNLEIKKLNNIDIIDIIENKESSGEKFQNLIIKGDLHFEKLLVENINGIDLNDLKVNSMYIDKSEDLTKLNFKNVSVENLQTTWLNNQSTSGLIEKINQAKTLDQIGNLYINGSVEIEDVYNLTTINNLGINNLLQDGATNFDNNTISGKVKFLGNVKIRDFYVTVVNDVNLKILSRRTLYKSWNQAITQPFTFTNLKSKNLITRRINDFNVERLIDVSSTEPQELFVPNGLRFLQSPQIQNLVGNLDCDLTQALNNLRSPQSQYWNNVTVLGNATFFDKESILCQIFDNVVTNNSDNTITGEMTFGNHICAKNINTIKNINNIDILEILQDAFVNDPEVEQIVTGKKTFVSLEADSVTVLQNAEVPKINNYEISKINNGIITKNSIFEGPITGKKVLIGGLQTNQIKTEKIGGVRPENLVSLDTPTIIPQAIFDTMIIREDFNVPFINNMPFDIFFQERLLKNSSKQTVTGNYFFENVIINGDVVISHINNIDMKQVVFDTGIQVIKSVKTFHDDLIIKGNMKAEIINGLKLSEIYERAAMKNEETSFNGSVTIMSPSLINGNIVTKYINNFPMDYMLDTSTKQSRRSEEEQIHEITNKIANFVNKYLNITIRIPSEFLYLEKSSTLQISVLNAMSAQILETKDNILIHIESEEEGYYCGLPKICKCPIQQTMQISSKHSISSFMNKVTQRIYSYYGEDIIVNLITNSISTSSVCRTNMTKIMSEMSTLTWNTLPRDNNTGGFFYHESIINGYISNVHYFTIESKTYVVIGFYYDSVLDTHNMNSLVLRFNEDKTGIEEIQKIPTEGLRTSSLIHTAQGVILIMGNEKLEDVKNVTTKLFRFDRYKQQFELLREVPTFVCLFAVGVVLGTDSLIIMANERSVLHILKYYNHYDNYYFYQSFQLDYPVSSLSVFYSEGFGISDAYLTVVTSNNKYFIYSFQFIQGWKLESTGELDGMKSLIPFKLNQVSYLFVPSSKTSSLLTLIEHDSN